MPARSEHIRANTAATIVACALIAAVVGTQVISPNTAHASSQKALQASGVETTASGKTSVWVISGGTHLNFHSSDEVKGDPTPFKITYDKQGLVKKSSNYRMGSKNSITYTYSGLNLRKSVTRSDDSKTSFTYKVDGKGRVTKASASNGSEYEYTYGKKGRIAKIIKADAEKRITTTTYKYDAKGRLKSETSEGTTYKGEAYRNSTTYQYDKKGNVKKALHNQGNGNKYSCGYKNTYKKGRLVEQTYRMYKGTYATYTYEYKKISVPKSAVNMVKTQQRILLHNLGNMPFEAAHK